MFDKTAANPTSDPSATPTSAADPWSSIALSITTTFGVLVSCCIFAAFFKCCESIIKMSRKSRNQDDRRLDEDDDRGRTSWQRRSSNSPILPTKHRPTTDANEDEMNKGTASRRWDMDLRFSLLEQKVEELYYAINKVQDDHDKLTSVIEEIACEILSEAATMGDSGTEAGSLYSNCKSDDNEEWSIRPPKFQMSGEISELPGTEELLGRETQPEQLDDYPIPNRPFRMGRRTTPPLIPAKSSKRFDTLSPENPFSDPPEQLGMPSRPYQFTSEFGKGSSRPTSPIPYLPPPRPPPHGSRPPGPSLNSEQPISACAYFAPVDKMGPFAPRTQDDGRAGTSSSTSGDYRHGGDDRELRHRRSTSWQVSSTDDQASGRFDVERGSHGRHVGPGGFGTRDEVLDALNWEYSPARGWTSRQAARQRPAQIECESPRSSSDDTASKESDSSDETVRPVQGEGERAAHGQRNSAEMFWVTADSPHSRTVPESYIPSTGHHVNRPGTARYNVLPEQDRSSLLTSHDILGLAALILLNPDETDGFPRGFPDSVVRYRQGHILWARFLRQPTPNTRVLMWMNRRQIEDNIVRSIQRYCNTGDRAHDIDVPACEQRARAIVSALFRRASLSPRGRVTLLELWRSGQPRPSMPLHQDRNSERFMRELHRVRVNAPQPERRWWSITTT